MSARSVILNAQLEAAAVPRVKVRKVFKRSGRQTSGEVDLVRQFVRDYEKDQPREVTPDQVRALARVMRRDPETIKGWLGAAREEFNENASMYVNVHAQAVREAAGMDSAAGKDIAIRGAQWAMENLGFGGERVVDKTKAEGPKGTVIQIGVKIGGQNPHVVAATVDA